MKKRNGFVTNSSSTTYVCEISGESETFWDGSSHRDYGFVMCENEHPARRICRGRSNTRTRARLD